MGQTDPVNLNTRFIVDQDGFARVCDDWIDRECIGVDTEFMRTDTFFAKIGLLQVATASEIVLVDPLQVSDWEPFREVMSATTMVIHSASEDLNLFLTHCGALPRRMFDTQLAAAFLGLGFSNSYQSLCESVLEVHVDKGETRSDWLRRPLRDEQLRYAADDVRYLLPLMGALESGLREQEKRDWFDAENEQQLRKARLVEDEKTWEFQFGNISNAWRLNERALGFLQALGYWREVEARRRNKPRNWVAKDNDLFTIANELARSEYPDQAELSRLKLEDRKLLNRYGKTFIELLQSVEAGGGLKEVLSPPLQPQQRKTLKELQRAVAEQASDCSLEPELLGRRKQLVKLMQGWLRNGKLEWEGGNGDWRRPLLEQDFREILESA